MKKIVLSFWLFLLSTGMYAQEAATVHISGTIYASNDQTPLPGALIKEEGSDRATVSDGDGKFVLRTDNKFPKVLIVSFIGFSSQKVELSVNRSLTGLEIYLDAQDMGLQTVEVLSTGFQEIPKERATGSFVQLDQELINRRVSTNLLERLEDVTSGLVFNRAGPASDRITIRGRSTIFAETQPLIIIDNFPYDGPLENINPNDVESITILRDAAAASIWGARSGNGVIVIKTKRGRANQPMQITFNANTNFIEAPNLLARPWMDISDFIDVENELFNRGVFNAAINNLNARQPMSPVIETLLEHRSGKLADLERDRRLDLFRQIDSRQELMDNYYRSAVNNQLSLGFSGGKENYRYSFSVGHDHNLAAEIGNSNSRTTISSNNNWSLLNRKLDFGISFNYTESNSLVDTQIPTLFPYEKLRNDDGSANQIVREHSLRYVNSFLDTDWLDWRFFPMEEIGIFENSVKQQDARVNFSVAYKVTDWLSTEVLFQHWNNQFSSRNYRPSESFEARHLINRFTQINTDGSLSRPIPIGGFMDSRNGTSNGSYGRVQAKIDRLLSEKFQLNGIIGTEFKDVNSIASANRYYGYNNSFAVSLPVNLFNQFRINPNNALATIPSGIDHEGRVDRFISYFGNFSLAYKNKLVLTGSARKDASNLFGVETNLRAVPLWSTGLSWILSEESFFNVSAIPYLRFRGTYGFNGNVDRTLSAFTTASYFVTDGNFINPGQRYAIIRNPPNRNLRWEKIQTINVGFDASLKNNLLDISLELYSKNGLDLIGDFPIAPTTGFTTFRGNFADTQTRGWDLTLNSKPMQGKFNWEINFFLSRVKEEVTNYEAPTQIVNLLSSFGITPFPGKPLFSVFSMKSGGLDPNTGDPIGFLNGEPSTNFIGIRLQTQPDDLIFHGSARPQAFGALRNTFSFGDFYISPNVAFRLDYYFRRLSVDYTDLYAGRITHRDYNDRWRQPGDELITTVPSMPLTNNTFRQFIYTFSETLVERGDHIRLQDIRAGYHLKKSKLPWLPVRSAEFYTYVNNLGLLWKKTKFDVDPDFQNIPPPRSIAIGLRIDL
ncbi:SusC/RagA family TonB-linked outer membrane protein [Cecembia rubra]|uniref:TonB-linked SusC/RagA family outer membrane protein n=1 Tax=Cecembia rubra TaxID=1485585 RepID=A0A2P8DM79_9BACT|nr:SusC/RagA family TonB-linked outer membrane protein [Cecembia rubra]PSK98329.1 TonB-linked SusC/RagA family outer membrane protein [Cecembia rubra]